MVTNVNLFSIRVNPVLLDNTRLRVETRLKGLAFSVPNATTGTIRLGAWAMAPLTTVRACSVRLEPSLAQTDAAACNALPSARLTPPSRDVFAALGTTSCAIPQ